LPDTTSKVGAGAPVAVYAWLYGRLREPGGGALVIVGAEPAVPLPLSPQQRGAPSVWIPQPWVSPSETCVKVPATVPGA
jgi:hypothetical protein